MLLNGMFAFRKTIVQIKRNPDTSTESIADQQPSTYPQHLYKYVSLTTAVQILVYLIFLCLIDCISLDILS